MSGIKKKFLFQLLYAFSQIAFPLITYPYITRKLGAEGLGLIGYVEYVSGFIITIASFGIPFFGVREIAKWQDDPAKKNTVLRQLFSLHLLASIIGCVVFVCLIKANARQSLSTEMIGLGCLNILLPAFIAEWYMQGTEAFVFITIRGIALRLAGLLALFLFVSAQQDYIIYYLIIVLVQGAVAFSNMIRAGVKNFLPDLQIKQATIKSLWHCFLTTSIISVYVFFDVVILGWVTTEAHVGYYTIAVKTVKLSLLLVLSLNVILLPRISYLHAKSDRKAIGSLVQNGLHFVIALTVPMAAVFFFLAPQIIQLMAGPAFGPSVKPLQILSTLPLIIGISHLFCYQLLIPFGREKNLLLCVAITCVASLLFHTMLAPAFLEKGTAAATLATEALMTVLTAWFGYKTFTYKFPFAALTQAAVAVLPFIILVYVSRSFFSTPVPVLLLSLVPGAALYWLMQLLVFKSEVAAQGWQLIKASTWRAANG